MWQRQRHTSINNLDINARFTPTKPQFEPTQRISIWIRARGSSIKQDMRDGTDHVRVCAGDAAGAEARVVVGQISRIGTTMRGGKREIWVS